MKLFARPSPRRAVASAIVGVFVSVMVCFAVGVGKVQAQVSLDLRDADLRSFVEIVSENTGRSFVVDPAVRGTVTVLAPNQLTADELYEVFLSVLELNRLTVIEGAGADRIVQMNTARELSSGDTGGVSTGYETRVIPVRHVPLQEVIDVVRPLLPSEAVITPVPGAKLLILSDRGANHARITRLIKRLDQPRQADPIEMIQLQNAQAGDVLQVVQSMGIVPNGASVSIDRRSNALLVSGPDEMRQRVRLLASRLDTQRESMTSRTIALNYADAAAIADVVLRTLNAGGESAQQQVRIVPEPQTNTLLVFGPQDRMSEITRIVKYLDRRPTQVLVEAVIFEMTVDGFSDLSVQFAAVLNDALVGGVQFALPGRTSLINLVSAVSNGNAPDLGPAGVLGGGTYNQSSGNGIAGLITAIASVNSTRLLSTPSILTLNNQEAEIVVAQNVPFVTGSYTSTGDGSNPENPFQTIERQDVGLTLNVTPQINADRTVRMVIKQEVSNLTNSTSTSGGEITARRALSTTALVADGNVIMLGGLLEDGSGAVNQRVPGISNLPLVGGLFRGKNSTKNQRVLLVLLRPQVVSNDAEARRITKNLTDKAYATSASIQPLDEGGYPRADQRLLPYDGADLNQPFDAGFIDAFAQSRNFPPLPSRLRFNGN